MSANLSFYNNNYIIIFHDIYKILHKYWKLEKIRYTFVTEKRSITTTRYSNLCLIFPSWNGSPREREREQLPVELLEEWGGNTWSSDGSAEIWVISAWPISGLGIIEDAWPWPCHRRDTSRTSRSFSSRRNQRVGRQNVRRHRVKRKSFATKCKSKIV